MKGEARIKKSNLLEGIAFILGGFIILCIALLTTSNIDSILIGFGAGGISSGIVMISKYFYWNTSKNKERYQEIIEHSRLIVLYLGGYLIFQIVIGIVIFNQLLKKYV